MRKWISDHAAIPDQRTNRTFSFTDLQFLTAINFNLYEKTALY
jgi:hypothetical protein